MGRDKAGLPFAGQPLIAHALSIFRDAGLTASIAGAHADLAPYAPVIADSRPGSGPLGGICDALAASAAQHAVFLPVDMPLVPPSLVAYLLHHAQITGRAVTLASVNGTVETFPAVIGREAVPFLAAALESGRRGCLAAFESAASGSNQRTDIVIVEALVQSGQVADLQVRPPIYWFVNLNTPADLARTEALAARRIA
jgi:molybdenum cofactor guanylyltransferase